MKRQNNPFTPLFWKIVGILILIAVFTFLGLEAARNRSQIETAEKIQITIASFSGWEVKITGSDRKSKVQVTDFSE